MRLICVSLIVVVRDRSHLRLRVRSSALVKISDENIVDDVSVDVSQSESTALIFVCETFVVDAH